MSSADSSLNNQSLDNPNFDALNLDMRPRLLRGVKLKFDGVRNRWVLLAPERIIIINTTAAEILKRCTGHIAFEQIIDDLSKQFHTDRSIVERDARTLLMNLHKKCLVDL